MVVVEVMVMAVVVVVVVFGSGREERFLCKISI